MRAYKRSISLIVMVCTMAMATFGATTYYGSKCVSVGAGPETKSCVLGVRSCSGTCSRQNTSCHTCQGPAPGYTCVQNPNDGRTCSSWKESTSCLFDPGTAMCQCNAGLWGGNINEIPNLPEGC